MHKNCLALKNITMYIVFIKMKDCIFYLRGKINFKLFDMYVKNKLIYGAKQREFSKGQK